MSIRNSISEDDLDVSDTFDTAKASFRVSVCLRRYFGDVRARAYFLVRPSRRVRWLQRRIQRTFRLPDGFCLCAAGHLLPPAEPLRLLGPGDRLEVIPLQEAHADRGRPGTERQSGAAAARPDEETITSTLLTTSNAYAAYIGATQNHSDATNNTNHLENRNSEYHPTDTGSSTESPSAAARRSAPDAVDSASGHAQQAGAAEGGSCNDRSLLSVKRRALALLDAHCGPGAADEDPPPRRVRRRVRRRPRRVSRAPPSPGAPCPSRDASPVAAPPSPAPATPRDVAQNEDACARKPRVVHSLDIENI